MIIFGGLAAAAAAIVCAEAAGRGRVLYSRPLPCLVLYLAFLAPAPALLHEGPIPAGLWAHLLLSGLFALGAWFGFRIHLSNSISLTMLELIARGADTREALETAYGRPGRVERRLAVLARSSYVTGVDDPELTPRLKTRWLIKALGFLRSGSEGVAREEA